MEDSNNSTEKIISFLKNNKNGSTPSDIARKTGMNRMTVSKYLNILKAINLVSYKEVGMAKVYFLNETPIFKALSEPENNYFNMVRQAINDIGIGVGIIDKNMNIIWFNKNMHEWIGKKPEETNGKHCYCTFKNNKEICIKCPGALTLKDGKVHEAVQDGINKNGKIMYFYLTTSPLYDLDKKVVGFVEMVKEISHCDNIRKELEELKSRLKS